MKIGTSRSPKLLRLATALGVTPRDALGLLNLLWEWTWEQTPRGDVGRWTDGEIAVACGEPPERGQELVAALLDARWLDHDSTHRLVIHDYAEHAPEFLRKRLNRKDMQPLPGGDGMAADAPHNQRQTLPPASGSRSPGPAAARGGKGRGGDSGGSRAKPLPPSETETDRQRPAPGQNPHPPSEPPPAEVRSVSDPPAEAVAKVSAMLDAARGAPAENRPPRRVIDRLTDRARRLGVGALLDAAKAYAADQHVSTSGKSLGQLDAEWDKWSAEARKGGGPRGELTKTLALGRSDGRAVPLTEAELNALEPCECGHRGTAHAGGTGEGHCTRHGCECERFSVARKSAAAVAP